MSDPIPETKFDHLQKQISYIPKYIQDESIILEVRNLKKFFPIEKGIFFKKTIAEIKAVDDISFILHKGETLGIAGESGSGKSTLAKTISQIYIPTFGEIWLKGINLNQVENQKSKEIAKSLTLVFQEAMKSLDPRMTVLQTILEPLEIQKRLPNKIRYSKAKDLLLSVGLSPNIAFRYPHELSGGQLQRICIARALSYQPEIIIFDEPVSSLDVSLQASIINTLVNIQDKLNLTYIFIAHDLTVIRKISHRVLIMYLGKIMEIGKSDQIYENAMHPYTQALLSTILIPDPDVEPTKVLLHGELPTPINPPPGCLFCTRCHFVRKKCYFEEPILEEVESEHLVACHFYKEIKSGLHLPTEKLGENSDY